MIHSPRMNSKAQKPRGFISCISMNLTGFGHQSLLGSRVFRPRLYCLILLIALSLLLIFRLSLEGRSRVRYNELEEFRARNHSLALRQEVYDAHSEEYRKRFNLESSPQNLRVVWLDTMQTIIKDLKLTNSTVRFRAPRLSSIESSAPSSNPSFTPSSNFQSEAYQSGFTGTNTNLLLSEYGLELNGLVRHEGVLLEIIRELIDTGDPRMVNRSCLLAGSDWSAGGAELPEFAARIVREASWSTSVDTADIMPSVSSEDKPITDLRYYCVFDSFQLSIEQRSLDSTKH